MKIFGKTLLAALQVAAFTTALAQAQDAQDANVCLLMYSLAGELCFFCISIDEAKHHLLVQNIGMCQPLSHSVLFLHP